MITNRIALTFSFLILYSAASAQSVVGSYLLEQEGNNSIETRLIMKDNGAFIYFETAHGRRISICSGFWEQKASQINFFETKNEECGEGLNILRVDSTFDSTVLKGKAITIFFVGGDTSRLVGAIVTEKSGRKSVQELERPIILEENESEIVIEIEYISYHAKYIFNSSKKNNSFNIYLCLRTEWETKFLTELPFKSLLLEKNILANPSRNLVFKKR